MSNQIERGEAMNLSLDVYQRVFDVITDVASFAIIVATMAIVKETS